MAERNHERPEEQDESEIKVTDKRLFTADGSLRHEVPEQEEEEEGRQEEPATGSAGLEGEPGPGFEHRPVEEPQGVDFTMLINAMAQPALLFLGEIAHPGTGQLKIDLEQARIQIDMLELLRVKCRGNLTSDEEGLLERMLYQLRMLYVSRSGQPEA
jgi:hypothetical protein